MYNIGYNNTVVKYPYNDDIYVSDPASVTLKIKNGKMVPFSCSIIYPSVKVSYDLDEFSGSLLDLTDNIATLHDGKNIVKTRYETITYNKYHTNMYKVICSENTKNCLVFHTQNIRWIPSISLDNNRMSLNYTIISEVDKPINPRKVVLVDNHSNEYKITLTSIMSYMYGNILVDEKCTIDKQYQVSIDINNTEFQYASSGILFNSSYDIPECKYKDITIPYTKKETDRFIPLNTSSYLKYKARKSKSVNKIYIQVYIDEALYNEANTEEITLRLVLNTSKISTKLSPTPTSVTSTEAIWTSTISTTSTKVLPYVISYD